MGRFSNGGSITSSLTLSDFTLRNHKKGITALQTIKMALVSKVPVLLSGDSDGPFCHLGLGDKKARYVYIRLKAIRQEFPPVHLQKHLQEESPEE